MFDVGETLVDETRLWAAWADWLGVPRFTFMAAFGATISRGLHHHEVFRMVRPELDLAAERRRRDATGGPVLLAEDFYPDAIPCLTTLHRAGYKLGIVGNQPSRTEAVLLALDVPLAMVGSSETWGVHKPDPAFFQRISTDLGLRPQQIAYVGDRLDNDIQPAAAAGMIAVFVRRGPWALIQAGRSVPPEAAVTVESLAELPAALDAVGRG